MNLSQIYSKNKNIEKICDNIIRETRWKIKEKPEQKNKSANFNFHIKNKETLELIKGLFETVKEDDQGKMKCTDLIDHLISLGVNLDPVLFSIVIKKSLKVDSILQAKISPEEFNSMIFEDKRAEKILNILKNSLHPRRAHSVFPKIIIKNVSKLTPKPFTEEDDVEDLKKVIRKWWVEISPLGDDKAPFSTVAQLLVDKEVFNSLSDAKKFFSTSLVSLEDFLALFCVSIMKLQIIEASKKVNKIGMFKFLPAHQKISSLKRKLLISRISPADEDSSKTHAEKVLSGLINFRTRIKLKLK